MQQLRSDIAETIKMPLFLIDLKDANKDEIIGICYKILDSHYRGVVSELLQDRVINRILYRIENLSIRLKEVSEPNINLLSWIWINNITSKWIELAVSYEEFEAAANLRKITNFEYA